LIFALADGVRLGRKESPSLLRNPWGEELATLDIAMSNPPQITDLAY